jgi:hypothetical protein
MSTYVQWPNGHFQSFVNANSIRDLKWKLLQDDPSLTPSIDLVYNRIVQRDHREVVSRTYYVVTCTAWVFWLDGLLHVRIGQAEDSHHVKVYMMNEEELILHLYKMLGSLEDEDGVRLYQTLKQDMQWLIATYLKEFHDLSVSGVWLE